RACASIRLPSASAVGNGFFLQAVTTSTARPHPASASPPRIGNPARHERCREEGRRKGQEIGGRQILQGPKGLGMSRSWRIQQPPITSVCTSPAGSYIYVPGLAIQSCSRYSQWLRIV